ncbi:MAG: acyl-ACP thioesterase [Ignavibacteria bacterium]|jgi:medium-chain acyl-[acyl-carrier-protein] hydrolase|nr:acyl-ACP thioesterase [Ignavibacteria bacterium]MCU7501681.1 acyl-ACP thioesterase [Ignavibacteria bacterium]MCU7518516.1 acyl-ACP thioesterase [Ignavibacteria bacterium]
MQYERNYFIHYYDSDLKKRALITSLMRYFEDIAILQSEEASVGLDYYTKNRVAWVLYKWDIEILDYPKFKDTIRVVTCPMAFAKFYAFRSFDIYSSKDEHLVKGGSMWFFVDMNSRRPSTIPQEVYDSYQISPANSKPLEIEDPKAPGEITYKASFKVRQSDIDTNAHVNNIKYIEWALEALPQETFNNYTLRRIKVVYKKETMYGRVIDSSASETKDAGRLTFRHKISDGDLDLCFIETEWLPDGN